MTLCLVGAGDLAGAQVFRRHLLRLAVSELYQTKHL